MATILVIEDNLLNMEMAQELLEEIEGVEILHTADAIQGIHLTRLHLPDLILMDMQLPLLNGYDTCRILRTDPVTRDIPIVAFTANATTPEIKRAMDSGCIGIISKPIDVDTFASTVISYLGVQNKPISFNSTSTSKEDEFFLKLSHDMQSPLRKIQQSCTILEKSHSLEEEDREFIEIIERSANRLINMLTIELDKIKPIAV